MNEMKTVPETDINFSEKISLATRKRLEEAIEKEIIDENSLISFLKNKENRVNKRERKLQKKNGQSNSLVNKTVRLITPKTRISLADNLTIWGEELVVSEKIANHSEAKSVILKDFRFNFFTARLNGLSIRKMAQKYSDLIILPKTKTNDLLDRVSSPGYYYLSLKNELVNLSPAAEKENWPNDFYRLDINLTVELLVCLLLLKQEIPKIFFKTGYYPNGKEVCVRVEQGKIIFRSADKMNGHSTGLCLYNNQAWMDNWVEGDKGGE